MKSQGGYIQKEFHALNKSTSNRPLKVDFL